MTTRGHSNSNAVAESGIKSVIDMARTLLIDSGLPPTFFGEALKTATYLTNRLPHCSNKENKTPFELFKGKVPRLDHLKRFGCVAYVHQDKHHRTGKARPRALQGVMAGYEPLQEAYRIYIPATKKF